MDSVIGIALLGSFAVGAVVVIKSGPFLDRASQAMGKRRKVRGKSTAQLPSRSVTEPGKKVEPEEET